MEICVLIVVKTCLCMFQLAPVTISTYERQLYGSCGVDSTCIFLRLVTNMSDRFLKQWIDIKFCVNLGRRWKHGAFNMVPETNYKLCNGNTRHHHDSRELACLNHNLRQCSSLSSILRALFTLNSFHKANSQPSLLYGNIEGVTWGCT
jgi:hypothetical protein